MSLSRFIGDLLRKFPWLIAANAFVLVVAGVVGVGSLFTIAPIVDFILNPDLQQASRITRNIARAIAAVGLPVTLATLLALFVLFQMVKNALTLFSRYLLLRTTYAIVHDLMVGTFASFFRARWSFFTGIDQGILLNTFLREITILGDAFLALGLFFSNLLRLLLYLAVPFYLSWRVASLSLTVALVLAVPFLLLGRVSYRLGRANTTTGNEISGCIQENLGLAKIILGFGNHERAVGNLERVFRIHRAITLKAQTLRIATPLMYEPVGMLVLTVTVLTAQRIAIPLAEVTVLLWTLHNCVPLLGDLLAQRNSLVNVVPSYDQLKLLQGRAQELRQTSGDIPFRGFERELTIDRLTFAYPGHEPTLVDVSVRIPKGGMFAIVGESGAGKSTLIDMLMGFNEPLSGQIKFDGVALPRFDIDSYRRRVGYVPQENVLFNATIRNNLLWANDVATDADLREACRQANAIEFIERLPEGLDTVVGDRGVRLSVGQCQRLALARAILRRPDLLVLDEATSSLDTQSERLIQSAIESVARDTTVIVIAHRLSTIVNAERIYVLHRGRVVEEGAYEDLVTRGGHFAKMTQLQVLEAVR